MTKTGRVVHAAVMLAALVVASSGQAAAARFSWPSLDGETLSGTYTATFACAADGSGSASYTASGEASGPYAGTYTATATLTLAAADASGRSPVTVVSGDFRIVSGWTVVTGRTLAFDGAYADCATGQVSDLTIGQYAADVRFLGSVVRHDEGIRALGLELSLMTAAGAAGSHYETFATNPPPPKGRK